MDCPDCDSHSNSHSSSRSGGSHCDDFLEINSHLFLAVFAAIFCCAPFGIVAVYYASKVDTCAKYGDKRRAMMYSQKAWNWGFWTTLVCAFIWIFFYGFCFLTGFMQGMAQAMAQNGQL